MAPEIGQQSAIRAEPEPAFWNYALQTALAPQERTSMKLASWSYPTRIRIGADCIGELPAACHDAGIKRPLFVTDEGLAGHEACRDALTLLDHSGLHGGVFSDISPNPDERSVEAGIREFVRQPHDGVIGFGGGSAIDVAKVIAFSASRQRSIWEFEDGRGVWGPEDAGLAHPIVAVPLTAGTGSEVGRAGVITNSRTRTKTVIFHPDMLPQQVVADPLLTMSMPASVTAGTGMDAFAHCLEAYCSVGYHPMSDGIALEGMQLVQRSLSTAYECGDDVAARTDMMSAAMMGAVAFQKGLGAIHSISHPVGALYNLHHGTINAVVMPYVLRFNRHAIEGRIESVARYLGISGGFDGFLGFVLDLRAALNIPENLSQLGVPVDKLDQMASMALRDPTASGNPVPLDETNIARLMESCFD